MTEGQVSDLAARQRRVQDIALDGRDTRGALMPILHRVVEELGNVTHDDTATIARVLNLTEADVHGVASFYKDFRRQPVAACLVQVCRGEACQAVGAHDLVDHLAAGMGLGMDATSQDGTVETEQIFCFGNCALGPTVAVNGRLHGRVSPSRLDGLIEQARS